LVLEEEKVSRKPRNAAITEVDSEVEHAIIVDAGQVAQSVLDALQKFTGLPTVSAIDGWVMLSARHPVHSYM
jgi:hypothetical protein